MKPPGRVKIGSRTFAVDIDLQTTSGHDANGICLARYERIAISPDQGEATMRTTVLHELIHACFDEAVSGGPFDSEETEERACATLAPRLLDLLRHNPSLVTYLTS